MAKTNDRIHMRTTLFRYGRSLEVIGDTSNAVKQYEQSETHRSEVPRMLLESNNEEDLEAYVNSVNDTYLFGWLANYWEGKGNVEKALHYYQRASDHLSITRIYCSQSKLSEVSVHLPTNHSASLIAPHRRRANWSSTLPTWQPHII